MYDDDAPGTGPVFPGSSSTALVPLTPAPRGVAAAVRTRPDSCFVTQLIATADHAPQTRTLCRASPQDAEASYRAAARWSQPPSRAARAARLA